MDERLVIDEEKQLLLKRINDDLNFFKNKKNVDEWVNNRKSLLQQKIDKRPDKEPVHKGNITMKQHLQNLKKELDDEPDKVVARLVSKLEKTKSDLEVNDKTKSDLEVNDDSSRDK